MRRHIIIKRPGSPREGGGGGVGSESRNFRWGIMTTVTECHRRVGGRQKSAKKTSRILCMAPKVTINKYIYTGPTTIWLSNANKHLHQKVINFKRLISYGCIRFN